MTARCAGRCPGCGRAILHVRDGDGGWVWRRHRIDSSGYLTCPESGRNIPEKGTA